MMVEKKPVSFDDAAREAVENELRCHKIDPKAIPLPDKVVECLAISILVLADKEREIIRESVALINLTPDYRHQEDVNPTSRMRGDAMSISEVIRKGRTAAQQKEQTYLTEELIAEGTAAYTNFIATCLHLIDKGEAPTIIYKPVCDLIVEGKRAVAQRPRLRLVENGL